MLTAVTSAIVSSAPLVQPAQVTGLKVGTCEMKEIGTVSLTIFVATIFKKGRYGFLSVSQLDILSAHVGLCTMLVIRTLV